MKLLVIFVFLIVGFCNGEETPPASSDVITLTMDTFEKVYSGTWLVEFFAPWCGHCKKLAPTWEELATASKGKFNVAKVDCTVEKDVCGTIGVRGYPTVKLFVDGKIHDYNGQRTTDAFTTFVEGLSNVPKEIKKEEKHEEKQEEKHEEKKEVVEEPTSDVVILTDANFVEKTKEGDWLLKFYAPWCGHCKRLAPTWDELATKAKGKFHVAKIDCTVETETCAKESIRGYPTVKLVTGGKTLDYKGPRTTDDFMNFVENSKAGRDEL